jgi:hypothetical protein
MSALELSSRLADGSYQRGFLFGFAAAISRIAASACALASAS